MLFYFLVLTFSTASLILLFVKTTFRFSIHFIPVFRYQCLDIKFFVSHIKFVKWHGHIKIAMYHVSLASKELLSTFSFISQPSLIKRTPRMSFFGGHKAQKLLALLSTCLLKTPAAAPGTAHASPLNPIVIVQSKSYDFT